LLKHFVEIDGLSEIKHNIVAHFESVRLHVGQDSVHSDVPQWNDDGHVIGFGNDPAHAPFESYELIFFVDPSFWKYVNPLAAVQLLYREIDSFLMDAATSDDRYAFPPGEEPRANAVGEADIVGRQRPSDRVYVENVAERQYT